jgi:beta-fructofuranosidase
VVRGDDGVWRMFYTALSTRGRGLPDQRIGVAESDDLLTWRRSDRPLLEVDNRWYESYEHDPTASDAWRDPHVFKDPDGDGWHLLVTARVRDAAPLDGGVIGHARSHDLRHWEVGPPLSAPAGFRHLEVPQVRVVDGTPLLLFSCLPGDQTPERARRSGRHALWVVPGDSVVGPWDVDAAQPFSDEPFLYAAPLVQRRDGGWALLGFRNTESEGEPALEITDPIPVSFTAGRLTCRR